MLIRIVNLITPEAEFLALAVGNEPTLFFPIFLVSIEQRFVCNVMLEPLL